MSYKRPTYLDLKAVAVAAFRDALQKRNFSKLQAFSFSYEHLGVFIDGECALERIFALTAVFKVAFEANVELAEDGLFANDVLDVLQRSYKFEAPVELGRDENISGINELNEDMRLVESVFLRGSREGLRSEI